MAPARKGKGLGTPALLALAAFLLAVGFGFGMLMSQQGCERKAATPKGPASKAGPAKAQPPQHPVYEEPAPKEPEHPAPRPAPLPAEAGLPKLALIIDDLGYAAPELVTRLCARPEAFSVAVLPYQEYSKESATIAHDRGKEVLLHLPMEGSPAANPGPDALRADMDEAQLKELTRKALADVPFRVGGNNHMGSRLTADRTRMHWVLEEFKARKLFFIDSRTTKDTVAADLARQMGIPAAQRQIFLDDDKAFPEIEKQWERALALAKRDGEVVVIGHIYPETVGALEKLLPKAKGEVRFVKAREAVR